MYRSSATFRISIALASLSVSVLVLARAIGLLPDHDEQRIQARIALAESVALTCAASAAQGNEAQLDATLRLLVARCPDLLAAAVKSDDYTLRVQGNSKGFDDPQVVSIPLQTRSRDWGELELTFTSLRPGGLIGFFESSTVQLIAFFAALNCLAFFWYLRRVLQHLNPSRVIPPRVRSMLDTFAEGLLVLSREGRIVLANEAFAKTVGETSDELQGRCVKQLPWSFQSDSPTDEAYPWELAAESSTAQTGHFVSLKTAKDNRRTFMVNAAPVIDSDGSCHGILATFDDVTEIQHRNAVLRQMLNKLEVSRERIRKQN